MEFVTDYRVENYALNTCWEDFPEKVRNQIKMCGIDLTIALILGCHSQQFKIGEEIAQTYGLTGDIGIIGSRKTYNLLGAAIAMGHSSNSYDIDDGHRTICGHPGTSFIAGVLAAAYHKNLSLKDFLTTLVVCYEITIRWAMAMQEEYNYLHSTGTYGAFGTALGIGRILGFNKKQLNNALSIADYHAPMTPVMRAVEYPSMNKDGVPFGALIGTMAVIETICGSTGKTHILEKTQYKNHLNDLGQKYHILDLYFKPYTCCRWAHQPIRACLQLQRQYHFTPDEISQIIIHTFRAATRLSKAIPQNTDEAQYNIAYPIACSLVFGDVGYEQIKDDSLNHPKVIELMQKMTFITERSLENLFPKQRLAFVEIITKDGKRLHSITFDAEGEPEDPELNIDWIEKKFKRLTHSMINQLEQDYIINLFKNTYEVSIKQLISQINNALKI